jgi:hypothetical protein
MYNNIKKTLLSIEVEEKTKKGWVYNKKKMVSEEKQKLGKIILSFKL